MYFNTSVLLCLIIFILDKYYCYNKTKTLSLSNWRYEMIQEITFEGLSTEHQDVEDALSQIWTCIRASTAAADAETKLIAFRAAVDNGDVTIERDFDAEAGTLAITRTWDEDAWTAYEAVDGGDIDVIIAALTAEGITATGL